MTLLELLKLNLYGSLFYEMHPDSVMRQEADGKVYEIRLVNNVEVKDYVTTMQLASDWQEALVTRSDLV